MTRQAKQELFEALAPSWISGVTFSGGDPLHWQNRKEAGNLIEEIHEKFPEKTIWLYTGFLWEDIKDLPFLKYVDVLGRTDRSWKQKRCDPALEGQREPESDRREKDPGTGKCSSLRVKIE
ncbi:MAG: 4Fe-4S cluster-binding domain-containing protein [Pilosibacter sp.]